MNTKDIIVGILLIIPFVAYFAIPTYNRVNPAIGGLSFFYWYQTLWLAISALLFGIAAYIIDKGVKE
ncbi:hypothetical protein [Thermoplasma volcanium GSS1]|uniref:DUF3311 domain-containing protein n=1 Tax=Thermoplasma volcanium (strain ATCC 51530 / DSM 4299 / JCM 9571 / NBRC 15438 / GSS1) TaxID=273116 RepID=Q978U1_THEVO|nr:DUF3311 domain-containing protein [Thermoplasma volcanium]BAB60466.1 hypothetical protein [Thermoplasma volcanium GSS1]